MNITCPNCGTEYEVGKQDIGRFVTCEFCGKGFVAGARPGGKSSGGTKPAQSSRCQSSGIIALWSCVAILVLNLAALVVLCVRMDNNFREIGADVAKLCKSIDDTNEDIGSSIVTLEKKMGEMKKEICDELKQMDNSRHHDASQIYDRMGRMKLY